MQRLCHCLVAHHWSGLSCLAGECAHSTCISASAASYIEAVKQRVVPPINRTILAVRACVLCVSLPYSFAILRLYNTQHKKCPEINIDRHLAQQSAHSVYAAAHIRFGLRIHWTSKATHNACYVRRHSLCVLYFVPFIFKFIKKETG
jgi:hypothetical protein